MKQNRLIIYILIISFPTFFSSCAQYKLFDIQTLKPSDVSLPKDFVQPLVVANIYKGIQGSDESMAQAAIDSIAATEAVFVITESLYDSPWFQGLSIPNHIHYRSDSSPYILPFNWTEAANIAKAYKADLIISLEYIKVDPKVDQYNYWQDYLQLYYGSLTKRIYAYWRIYDLNNKKILGESLYRDTLTWEKSDYRKVRIGDQLPGFFSAAAYCGYIVGSEYSKKIAPSWMNEQRLFYKSGSKDMVKATEFAEKNQWIDAAAQWQRVLKNPKISKKIAAKAAFNMAVANEMLGSFDVALAWLNESKKYYPLENEDWYRRVIEYRIKVMEKF